MMWSIWKHQEYSPHSAKWQLRKLFLNQLFFHGHVNSHVLTSNLFVPNIFVTVGAPGRGQMCIRCNLSHGPVRPIKSNDESPLKKGQSSATVNIGVALSAVTHILRHKKNSLSIPR
ncbi:hypothetical protein TNCV_1046811 [Trichonephila clavipes]|nr:hypothetical protein TNCV_1046811 [Trichonephila clavipes]